MKQSIFKRNDMKIMTIGFVSFYLVCMILSTYFVKINMEHSFEKNIETVASKISSTLHEQRNELYFWDEENLRNYMNYILSTSIDNLSYQDMKYQQLSAAVYDAKTHKLFAQSTNLIGDSVYEAESKNCYYYPINEHFSEIGQTELLIYYEAAMEEYENNPSYTLTLFADSNTKELFQIHLYNSDSENSILDSMTSKDWDSIEDLQELRCNFVSVLHYPYLTDSLKNGQASFEAAKKQWNRWMNDNYLQNFPDNYSTTSAYCYELQIKDNLFEPSHYLCIRQTTDSWFAAMDDMKFIYLIGLTITIACIFAVIYSSNKYYRKRAALEEVRRDFTNTIAHELKTPLAIIRGFAENTLENTVAEKREYYQRQIIAQTEEMDQLVKEMIYISKLDSEELTLRKEPLSLSAIINEQLTRLKPLADEKNLEITYVQVNDLQFAGDKQYIERALLNILSNAIDYNRPGGTIHISLDTTQCSIENTGAPISKEDLPYVFEMFYTSDKNRSAANKHMGLGLYLAKKIFSMHRINISIRNTDTGVKVILSK